VQGSGLHRIWHTGGRWAYVSTLLRGNPIPISTCPAPRDRDYHALGRHFGPDNIHENGPGSLVSEDLIFGTYQNAGVRVCDIRDPFRVEEVGACVLAAAARMLGPRPGCAAVLHSAVVFVDARGLAFVTDFNAGLSIIKFLG
jgi:hypothetical protein